MSFIKEFKEFAMKGNLIDMAIAFVMGGAFGKLVSTFIDGIVMPVVGKITAGVDFKSLKYVLSQEQKDTAGKVIAAEAAIKYGEFITIVIDFLLVALFMFLLIKTMNRLKKPEPPKADPEPTPDQKLLAEIRDLLQNK